jgi:hypothetical protein
MVWLHGDASKPTWKELGGPPITGTYRARVLELLLSGGEAAGAGDRLRSAATSMKAFWNTLLPRNPVDDAPASVRRISNAFQLTIES